MRVLAVVWVVAWAAFSIPWNSASPTARWDRIRPPRIGSATVRADHILNFLFYVPVAPIGARLGWALPTLVVAGAAFSVTAEAVQLFSTDRNPDGNDVVLNVAGTLVGVALVHNLRRRGVLNK